MLITKVTPKTTRSIIPDLFLAKQPEMRKSLLLFSLFGVSILIFGHANKAVKECLIIIVPTNKVQPIVRLLEIFSFLL